MRSMSLRYDHNMSRGYLKLRIQPLPSSPDPLLIYHNIHSVLTIVPASKVLTSSMRQIHPPKINRSPPQNRNSRALRCKKPPPRSKRPCPHTRRLHLQAERRGSSPMTSRDPLTRDNRTNRRSPAQKRRPPTPIPLPRINRPRISKKWSLSTGKKKALPPPPRSSPTPPLPSETANTPSTGLIQQVILPSLLSICLFPH